MINLIIGSKGSGKTKKLITLAEEATARTQGNVVCVEKGPALKYSLTSAARLVDTDDYGINGYDSFYGLLCGICATNYDVTDIFVDATLRVGGRNMDDMLAFFHRVAVLSDESNTNFTFTLSCEAGDLPEDLFTIAQQI